MSKIVSRNRRLVEGMLATKSGYSRVVSCMAAVPTGPGPVYSYTQKVAAKVWLYKVKVWGAPKPPAMLNKTLFRVLTGTQRVSSAEEIMRWENILPLQSPGYTSEAWSNFDGSGVFEWTMRKYFEGVGRMFGIWAERGPVGLDVLYASFEISEG